MSRIQEEMETVSKMIELYCRKQHGGTSLCPECQELQEYAKKRLENCRFQENKGTCGKCPVHCYKPSMREKIRTVMRYSGPRMIFYSPKSAFKHILLEFKKSKETRG